MLSVAFAEAFINEVFFAAADGSLKLTEEKKDRVEILGALWKLPRFESGASILDKFDTALDVLTGSRLERGKEPCQSFKIAIDLRNALMHYKPEWIEVGVERANTGFVGELERRVAPHNLMPPGNGFWPNRALSADCSRWCLGSCLHITDHFVSRVGMRAMYEHVREKIDKVLSPIGGRAPST